MHLEQQKALGCVWVTEAAKGGGLRVGEAMERGGDRSCVDQGSNGCI